MVVKVAVVITTIQLPNVVVITVASMCKDLVYKDERGLSVCIGVEEKRKGRYGCREAG